MITEDELERALATDLVVARSHGTGGTHQVPGDKSISHRALLLAALTPGTTELIGLNHGYAVAALLEPLRRLGCRISAAAGDGLRVSGWDEGPPPSETPHLQVGPSSAAARLLIGMLAGAGRSAIVDGDATLRRRPMDWIVDPLRTLGAKLEYLGQDGCLPIRVEPSVIQAGSVRLKVGSAQCRSAVVLAAAVSGARVQIAYPVESRDHTCRALAYHGIEISRRELELTIEGGTLAARPRVVIPGDPSLAAFLVAAHLLTGRGTLRLPRLGLNPTRTGLFELLREAGAGIRYEGIEERYGEPVGELVVEAGIEGMRPLVVDDDFLLHAMLDEVPLACAVAACIPGRSAIHRAQELRFKETDRLRTTQAMLQAFGARVEVEGASIFVDGGAPLRAARVPSFEDHRIAMAAAVLGLRLEGRTEIEHGGCFVTSFPGFPEQLRALGHEIALGANP